jgi:hypothetical protein
MARKTTVISLFLLLALAGCVRSLYPLFTEDDLYFMPELVGTWISEEGKDTWNFTKEGEKEYILHHYQAEYEETGGIKISGDTVKFLAQLGKLNKYFFLDIFPNKPETKVKNSFYNYHLLPVHTISKLWIEGDTLKLSMLDNDWLEKMIDNNAFNIAHARPNDQFILTASTEELQALVIKYAENSKAFPNPGILHRLK